jgi:hypothetical protein
MTDRSPATCLNVELFEPLPEPRGALRHSRLATPTVTGRRRLCAPLTADLARMGSKAAPGRVRGSLGLPEGQERYAATRW